MLGVLVALGAIVASFVLPTIQLRDDHSITMNHVLVNKLLIQVVHRWQQVKFSFIISSSEISSHLVLVWWWCAQIFSKIFFLVSQIISRLVKFWYVSFHFVPMLMVNSLSLFLHSSRLLWVIVFHHSCVCVCLSVWLKKWSSTA